jgi:hypothetical protein
MQRKICSGRTLRHISILMTSQSHKSVAATCCKTYGHPRYVRHRLRRTALANAQRTTTRADSPAISHFCPRASMRTPIKAKEASEANAEVLHAQQCNERLTISLSSHYRAHFPAVVPISCSGVSKMLQTAHASASPCVCGSHRAKRWANCSKCWTADRTSRLLGRRVPE